MSAILSAILLGLAFPKTSWFWLAWIGLVPFFLALFNSKNLGRAAFNGFLFGLVFFGINLFCLNTLTSFAGYWAVAGWLTLIIFLSLSMVVFSLAVYLLLRNKHKNIIREAEIHSLRPSLAKGTKGVSTLLLTTSLSFFWVFLEWLRGLGLFGITTGDLGYTQASFIQIIQIASFASVYGVSFLIVYFNLSLALFIKNTKNLVPILIAVLLVLAAFFYGAHEINNYGREQGLSQLKVALIQPNIEQTQKMELAKLADNFTIHEQLTLLTTLESPDIIIWPETSVFTYLLKDPLYRVKLAQLAEIINTWMVIGTPHYEKYNEAYNSIVSLSPASAVVSRYDKQHLVPFGEYLPFRRILYPLLKTIGYYDSSYAQGKGPAVLKVKDISIAPAICFESTFPGLIKNRIDKNTAFILNVTNDAWFADSAALYQHLDADIFRAVENRKYFVQVGNTGITALIDPCGRVVSRLPAHQRDYLLVKIPLR